MARVDRDEAVMDLHLAANRARPHLSTRDRERLEISVAKAIATIHELANARDTDVPAEPNDWLHSFLDRGGDLAEIEEAVRLARYQHDNERITG